MEKVGVGAAFLCCAVNARSQRHAGYLPTIRRCLLRNSCGSGQALFLFFIGLLQFFVSFSVSVACIFFFYLVESGLGIRNTAVAGVSVVSDLHWVLPMVSTIALNNTETKNEKKICIHMLDLRF